MSGGPPVLVAGAGPVGLTAAAEFARRGVPVLCVDRATGPSDRSRALLVWPRTLEILRGIADPIEIAARSLRVDAFRYFSGAREVARMRFGDRTRPVILPQPDVEHVLLDGVRRAGAEVRWGTRLRTFSEQDGAVHATIVGPDGAEQTLRAAYLIGCDGAGSTVRERLGIPFDGSTYPLSFMLADARVEGDLQHDAVHYFCSARGVLVMIGLPNGRFRIFTSGPSGHSGSPTLELMQRLVDERAPRALRLRDEAWMSTFSVHARHVDRYRVGRVFLAGDAAHIHSPAGGQGLNTGVGDAHNLAWKLAMVHRGEAAPELLDSYERERTIVARSVVRQADLQTRAWLLGRRHEIALRDAAARVASAARLFDALHVPQLAGLRTTYAAYPAPARRRRPDLARRGPRPGALMPDVAVRQPDGAARGLRDALPWDRYTVLLWTSGGRVAPDGLRALAGRVRAAAPGNPATRVLAGGGTLSVGDRATATPERTRGTLVRAFGRRPLVLLVRPDGHVARVERLARVPTAVGAVAACA